MVVDHWKIIRLTIIDCKKIFNREPGRIDLMTALNNDNLIAMANKPLSFAIFLVITLILSMRVNSQIPPQQAIRKRPIAWKNTPLRKILAELVADFKVKICNPQNIEGVPLSVTGSGGESVTTMCLIVTNEEKGHAYLHYQKGVVYVAGKPFPHPFSPSKGDWPCNLYREN